jgi:hypothetical protein
MGIFVFRSARVFGLFRRWAVCAVALTLLSTASCSYGPSRVMPPSIDPGGAAAEAIELYDADGDGFIAGAELDKAPGLKAAMATLDTDKDGKVSADEIQARIEFWQGTQFGAYLVECNVTLNGQPLEDAIVTFDPEPFLADEIQAGEGISSFSGIAYPTIPKEKRDTADTPPGVRLGFYRVRISKVVNGKETVPAKYNSESTIGQQISPDDPVLQKGKLKYDLKTK